MEKKTSIHSIRVFYYIFFLFSFCWWQQFVAVACYAIPLVSFHISKEVLWLPILRIRMKSLHFLLSLCCFIMCRYCEATPDKNNVLMAFTWVLLCCRLCGIVVIVGFGLIYFLIHIQIHSLNTINIRLFIMIISLSSPFRFWHAWAAFLSRITHFFIFNLRVSI